MWKSRARYEGDCPMESHAFSDLEGLRIAVEMERRGVEFYRRAARLTKSGSIVEMLEELAAEEEGHQRDFSKLMEEQCAGRFAEAAVCYSGRDERVPLGDRGGHRISGRPDGGGPAGRL